MKELIDEDEILLEVGDEDISFYREIANGLEYVGVTPEGNTFYIQGKTIDDTNILHDSTVYIFLDELTDVILTLY